MLAEKLVINWSSPPSAPELCVGRIEIWSLPLEELPCRPELLEPAESRRLARYHHASGRRQYCASRTALRNILAAYLRCRPREVPLLIKQGGKPRLAPEPPPLYFNLSHASGTALLAVCADHKVGVDVENVRKIPDTQRIARRIFNPAELEILSRNDWNLHLFYQLWTALEARQKCLGRGVFGKPVSDDSVTSRVFELTCNQYAAIAWPADHPHPDFRFYRL